MTKEECIDFVKNGMFVSACSFMHVLSRIYMYIQHIISLCMVYIPALCNVCSDTCTRVPV